MFTPHCLKPNQRSIRILGHWESFRELWRYFGAGVFTTVFSRKGNSLAKCEYGLLGVPDPAFEMDLSVLKKITAASGILILPQNGTERLLLECVKAAGHTEVLLGHGVKRFEQDNEGAGVEVQNSGGETKSYHGRYLVGCDGAHSTVRQELGWELEGKTYPTRILLADIRIQDERDQLPWPLFASGVSGVLAGVRYQPQHWRIISTLNPGGERTNSLGSLID